MAAPSSEVLRGFELKKHFFGSMPILSGKANATLAVGQILVVSSGLLIAASGSDQDDVIVGIAKSAGAAGGTVSYIPAWPGVIFEGTVAGDGTAIQALADTQRFGSYGISVDAGNLKPYINVEETSNKVVKILDFVDAAGTASYGRVLFTFIHNLTNWGV